mgnify:FL=1
MHGQNGQAQYAAPSSSGYHHQQGGQEQQQQYYQQQEAASSGHRERPRSGHSGHRSSRQDQQQPGYKMHYGHGQTSSDPAQGQGQGQGGNVVYGAPPNPNNPSNANYNSGVIYGANGQPLNQGGDQAGAASSSYSRQRPMSAGATQSRTQQIQLQMQQQQAQQAQQQSQSQQQQTQRDQQLRMQQQQQLQQQQAQAHQQKKQAAAAAAAANKEAAAQATPGTGTAAAAVTIPTATVSQSRPGSASATRNKRSTPSPAAAAPAGGNVAEVESDDEGAGALGEHSGLNGMARNKGTAAAGAGAGPGQVAGGTDYVDIDEDDEELEAVAARRNPAGRSTNSGVIDNSASRTHPEVSTIADLAGGTVSMDIRSVDSNYLQERGIGITTVPNQFCSVAEAMELRKLLMMSNNNVRGGMVPSSTAVMDMYMVGKVIGVGSYGKVRAAWHRLTGSKVAIKTYDKAKLKDPAHWKRVHSEIKITEQTSHPRIARLYEAIETPKRMHLIMECLDGGNLCSYVKQKRRLSEDESRRIFFQLIQSIDYLHVMGVAHRDIKLENVLFGDTKDIKLIDFGFSTVTVPGKKLRVFCGTPSYMAPEIVRRVEYEGKPTDMWSLGILLYALLCGCFPFRAKTYPDLYRRIARGTFTVPDELSVSVRDLLRQLLNIEPTQRITAAAALRHPWLQSQFAQAPDINKMRLESTILVSDRPTDDIDDQLLAQMEEFGLGEKEVTQLIMTKTHTSITTLYYLLLDVLISERRRGGNRKALPSGLNTLRKHGAHSGNAAPGGGMNILRTNQQSGQGQDMHYMTNNGVPVVLNGGSGGGSGARPKSAGNVRPSQSSQGQPKQSAGYAQQQQAGGTVHLQQQISSNIPQRPLSAAAGRRS